jgi:osmoprotectant transport system substrate-binding protein
MLKGKRWICFLCILFVPLAVIPFSGCSNGDTSEAGIVRIAAKDFTEQYILGEMLSALVTEYTDLKVELTSGIAGETSIIHPAMIKGEFDIYPEYTSTAWMTVLKKTELPDDEALYAQLVEEYKKKYNLVWTGLYGFDNTYNLAVRKETIEKYGLKTYSDLAEHSHELIFGAGYEFFEREDGFQGLQKLYGFNFKDIHEMNLSLKYNALLAKQVDVITVYKTDGRLRNPGIVELEDDLKYFPSTMGGTIVRSQTLEKYPELKAVLMKLNGMITNNEMAALNAAVDLDGRDPKKVAIEFLRQKALIE